MSFSVCCLSLCVCVFFILLPPQLGQFTEVIQGCTEESVSPPTPAAVNYLHILREGWDLASPSPLHDRTLTAPILCRSCAWNHSCSEFNRTVALSCIEDTTLQYQALSSGSYLCSLFSDSFWALEMVIQWPIYGWAFSSHILSESFVLNFLSEKKWGCHLHHRNVRVRSKVSPSQRFVGHWLWFGCWGEQCGFHDEKDAAPKL